MPKHHRKSRDFSVHRKLLFATCPKLLISDTLYSLGVVFLDLVIIDMLWTRHGFYFDAVDLSLLFEFWFPKKWVKW